MRVASASVSENLVRQIQALSVQQSKLQGQVASGQRIAQPEDDPAALGRVLGLDRERRAIDQFGRNADRALAHSQATFSGLQQLKRLSDRATEIGTLGSGTLGPDEFAVYAVEVDQLIEQAVQVGNTTFGNDYLFAGTRVDTAPFAATRDAQGRVSLVTYAGDSGQAEIALSESSRVAPGTSPATNAELVGFVNQLVALRDSLQARDPAAIRAAEAGLTASEDHLVSALSGHGAVQLRIEVNRQQQQDRLGEIDRLVSAETDADMPSVIVKLNQSQTAYQAALQSASNIMKMSLLDYLR